MKLLRVEKDRYVFQLPGEELNMLALTLGLYPVVPPAHQSLSKNSKPDQANQKLLNEALAEQRKENKKLVKNFLADTKRFEASEGFILMTITSAEIEWLLQVLNDVHVGNWILMGSPEGRPRFSPNSENAQLVMGMDLACMFQSYLLDAIQRSS